MPKTWTAVDRYFEEQLIPADPVLEAVRAANRKAGLPAIDVSPLQGRFLELLVRISGARRVLEIGTLGGYSSIGWPGRCLRAASCSRSSSIRTMPLSRAEISRTPASQIARRFAWDRRSTHWTL